MVTVAAFATDTVRELLGTERYDYNILDGAITTTATNLTVQYDATGSIGGFGVAAQLQLEDELVHVLDATAPSTAWNVLRGVAGTTAAAHADNTPIVVNPRWPAISIYTVMKDEIRSWQTALFAVATFTVNLSATTDARAFNWTPTDDLFILSASFAPTTTLSWGQRSLELGAVEIREAQDTSIFPTGRALVLGSNLSDRYSWPYGLGSVGTFNVAYAKRFALTTFTGATDLETTVGIPASSVDLLRAGVKWRLLSDQEASRSNVQGQGESRVSSEVAVGSAATQAGVWKRVRDQRLGEEIASLRARYPFRVTY